VNPSVSAIIPFHGRASRVLACLQSVAASDYGDFEIIVVDDCSPGDVSALLAADFPEVRIVRLPENLGAAGARNEGMRRARGEYFFFVDSDVAVERGTLKSLVETALRTPKAGAVGPLIRYLENRRPYCVRTRIDLDTGRTIYHREIPPDAATVATHHIPCLWLVARSVVEEVGMMDPVYRTYFDESDWQGRMGRAGFRNLVCLSAEAFHDVPYAPSGGGIIAGMTSRDPAKAAYHLYHLARNRTIFMKKFASRSQYLRFLAFYNQLFLVYYIARVLLHPRAGLAGAYLRGYIRGLQIARRTGRIIKGTEERDRLRLIPARDRN
jgi:GT2 family glycosyltransferase